ncbi:hypothetical protein HAX54_031516 [Datura stramonium]|uniref:Gamma-secretase subunit PEN-2 n=1 Tax=Datura stramonium TaxID=4076 RepID=A0ABS8RGR1_DATST|nr:hypothetical protein [Datura stramonium]
MEAAPSNPTHNIISTANSAPSAVINMNASVANHRNPLGVDWPTVDGPLGLTEQESVDHARRFFNFGFLLLPWLWAVNCLYFWPVLRRPTSYYHPELRRCKSFIVLSTWDDEILDAIKGLSPENAPGFFKECPQLPCGVAVQKEVVRGFMTWCRAACTIWYLLLWRPCVGIMILNSHYWSCAFETC